MLVFVHSVNLKKPDNQLTKNIHLLDVVPDCFLRKIHAKLLFHRK